MATQIKGLELDLPDAQLFRSWILRRLVLNQPLPEGTQNKEQTYSVNRSKT
jgi:hypothetical protein